MRFTVLARDFTKDAIQVTIGSTELAANKSVTQDIRVVEDHEKNRMLYQVLEKVMDGSKVLIFTSTKKMADTLTRMLRQDGWPAHAIHGDKSQQECNSVRVRQQQARGDCETSRV
jgi:ATP-dependent RNA helicase DDX5/DBP2